jgi:hypothetical protein
MRRCIVPPGAPRTAPRTVALSTLPKTSSSRLRRTVCTSFRFDQVPAVNLFLGAGRGHDWPRRGAHRRLARAALALPLPPRRDRRRIRPELPGKLSRSPAPRRATPGRAAPCRAKGGAPAPDAAAATARRRCAAAPSPRRWRARSGTCRGRGRPRSRSRATWWRGSCGRTGSARATCACSTTTSTRPFPSSGRRSLFPSCRPTPASRPCSEPCCLPRF